MSNAALSLIREQLLATRPSFEEMNLNRLSFNKELEYAIQIFEKNDYLLKMNTQSIKNSLVNIALSGLTLNPIMKLAYLVPRKGICCLDPSYMGLCKILTDTGSVTDIVARVVYEKDHFDIELGSKGYVSHKPYKGTETRGKQIAVYSIATLPSGKENIDYMPWGDVLAIMKRSESVKSGKQSPWDTDVDEMGKKTLVKRHWKLLPKTERAIMAAKAIDLDNQANGIDFDQENKSSASGNAAATPNAPDIQTALATEDDFNTIIELLDTAGLPEKIFGGKVVPSKMKATITKKYEDGQLEKDKAEEYIQGLKVEVSAIPAAPPVEPAA